MEIITDIRHEKKQVLITLSNGESIRIPPYLLRQRPLSISQPINIQEFDDWLLKKQYRYALERAVGYLATRACSKKEISDKLLRIGYRPCTVEMVLYKLQQQGLINDSDFARQWVQSRSNRSLGRARIANELRQKGVSGQDISEALESIDEDVQLQKAVSLAKKGLNKAKKNEESRKIRARVSAMLARRGYSYDIIRKALSLVESSDEEQYEY